MVLRDAEMAESLARSEASQGEAAVAARRRGRQPAGRDRHRPEGERAADAEGAARGEGEGRRGDGRQAALQARAEAEQKLQAIRKKLEETRLQAEVVLPAEAAQQAAALRGARRGRHDRGERQGPRRGAEADDRRPGSSAGPDAKDIFLIQNLEQILRTVVDRVKAMEVGETHLLDNGDGSALATYVASYPAAVRSVLAEVSRTTGVDVVALLSPVRAGGGAMIGDLGSVVGVAIGVVLFFGAAALVVVKRLFHICSPNEVLVFSGGKSTVDGRAVGYRIVKGGSSLRTPLLERVDRMDITNMTVDVAVSNAYSKGGIPLTVAGVANLKVAGHQPLLNNALERLLGKGRPQIIQVAKDTLEGNLRGVLSQLTPEEVNQDKLRFAEKLLEEAEHDLSRLGLVLDVLKIQNVSDDVGYLNSLGRKQSAALDKSARVAEAQAHAEAIMREAENGLASRLALIDADGAIARAEADKRIMQCETGREAMVAEAVGKVTTAIAKAEAELKVQQARIEQVRLQLEADVVAPARADMEKKQAEARGKAAKIVEDGKATAAVLTQMIETWKAAGPNARDIFLMQKLQTVMSSLVETIQSV